MTMSISELSTTIASSERPTVVSNSETTGVANSETTTVTSSTETTTMASSTETTTGATVAETTTTTTAADAGPTNLLINGNFDLGTTSPWYTSNNNEVHLGSNKPFEGPSYGEVEYVIDEGQAYNSYVYQKIDKSRLKGGSYQLSAMLRVDFATNNINSDGCNSMAVGCYYGDPNMLNYVKGSFLTVSADSAADQWTQLITTCSLVEQTLSNYDYVSVVIGFSCANSIASVDAAAFHEVL
jgi:hypothetical protein